MKSSLVRQAVILAALALLPAAGVKTGLEVLVRDGFRPLQGRRVGLVTNHTGADASGRSDLNHAHYGGLHGLPSGPVVRFAHAAERRLDKRPQGRGGPDDSREQPGWCGDVCGVP